jgi:O-antigen/teichoic acid export membrane protein
MKWYYSRIAILFFVLLVSIGTFYVSKLIVDYQYDKIEVYKSWVILCVISSYSLYTLYYDSLLQGKGLIKKSKQITIISNALYLITAGFLILKGFGLMAIVLAQTIQLVSVRYLSYKSFYTTSMKSNLDKIAGNSRKEIIKVIYPNAMKIGLTIIGGFTADKFAIFIGSIYLPLSDIASYGISISLIAVIGGLSGIVINTYLPKITQLRVKSNYSQIKVILLRGLIVIILTYLIGGIFVLFLGDWALKLIKSKTLLMATFPLLIALLGSLNGAILTMTGNIIVTKNEVPFYKVSLLSGAATVLLLFIAFKYFHAGLLSMVSISLIVSLLYQSWKWPYELIKDLFYQKN